MNFAWPAHLQIFGRRRAAPDRDDAVPILPPAVRRDVLVLIAIKLVALAAIYWVFFAPNERLAPPRPAEIAAHLFDPHIVNH
jgi:hypothetical protein